MDQGRLMTDQLLLRQSSTGDEPLVGGIEYQERRAAERHTSPSNNLMHLRTMKHRENTGEYINVTINSLQSQIRP